MTRASVALSSVVLGLGLSPTLSCDKVSGGTPSASPDPATAKTTTDPAIEDLEEDSEDLSDEETAPAQGDAAAAEGDVSPPDEQTPPTPAPKPQAKPLAQPQAQPLPKPKYTKVDSSCGKHPGVGQQLKSFTLKTPDGKKMTNRSYGKRVLLVNFWGTWCKPCLEELPEFDRLYRRYRKHGLTLVAIATDEDAAPVKAYLEKTKLRAKVAIGGEAYAGNYESPKFPFTFVVDPSGTIKASYRGYEPKCMGKLEADIRAELEARAAQ